MKNLCGASLNDEAMQRIGYPTFELGTHVTIKTVQSFGLLGTVLVGPIKAATKAETRNWAGIQQSMTRAGRGGLILGVFVGPLLTYLKVRNETDGYKIWDRCYRLRYNRNQVRVDQASIVGAATGAAIAYGTASTGGAMFGGLVGMSAGIILAAVYNSM